MSMIYVFKHNGFCGPLKGLITLSALEQSHCLSTFVGKDLILAKVLKVHVPASLQVADATTTFHPLCPCLCKTPPSKHVLLVSTSPR